MARIQLDIAHSYRANPRDDADYALLPMRQTFEDGGAYALLGPSGCGKTTMLNIISGLVAPSQGSIRFDQRDVTQLPPQQRNIAQVFQFPVVYDTMTVAQNLAFPLRNRGMDEARARARVGVIAEMLDLSAQLDQRAAGLSADQKQKISLGRGLVREDVGAVLFDEPLTVIDPHLKWQLRRKLKEIHRELRLTLIYVTHDQVEALTFADSVLVMARGRVIQSGSPSELFEQPAHRFVGHFIGSPGMNFIPVNRLKHGGSVSGSGSGSVSSFDDLIPPGAITLGIRPEYLGMGESKPGEPSEMNLLAAKVQRIQDLGSSWLVSAQVESGAEGGSDCLVRLRLARDAAVPALNQVVGLRVFGPHTRFYDAQERLIGRESEGALR
ncbi:MAG: ABC transporter ATP-binding protein [Betaproteobacteria bacterium]|jgi:glycerol transport system ATP-binding protein|nr:ABC transporter ATP-binding protein [Betaproteobacteria bacterium]